MTGLSHDGHAHDGEAMQAIALSDKTLIRMLRQAFTRGYQAARSGKRHNAEMQVVVEGLLRYRDQCRSPIVASSELLPRATP